MEGKTNGLCIAGFVVSLGSLFLGLWGLTGLVGVALSAGLAAAIEASYLTDAFARPVEDSSGLTKVMV